MSSADYRKTFFLAQMKDVHEEAEVRARSIPGVACYEQVSQLFMLRHLWDQFDLRPPSTDKSAKLCRFITKANAIFADPKLQAKKYISNDMALYILEKPVRISRIGRHPDVINVHSAGKTKQLIEEFNKFYQRMPLSLLDNFKDTFEDTALAIQKIPPIDKNQLPKAIINEDFSQENSQLLSKHKRENFSDHEIITYIKRIKVGETIDSFIEEADKKEDYVTVLKLLRCKELDKYQQHRSNHITNT